MPPHIDLGKKGEELAAEWLTGNGYTILVRNWRHGRYEVDIIASHDGILHIIEVKSRQSELYGRPEESISRKKFQNIMRGASGWLAQFPGHKRIQYDVLAITINTKALPEFVLFRDVYL
jgi:putative endonuclease